MENQENQEIQDGPINDWVVSEGQDEVLSNTENTENTESVAEEPAEQVTENAEIAEDEISDSELLAHMLSEQYGTEFSSMEDFDNFLAENYTQKETEEQANPFASETLKQINDYVKSTGRSVEDYMLTQSLKPDEMSDEQAVMFLLQRENPGLSADDLKFYMQETYKLNAEEDSNEKRFGSIAMKKEAMRARNEINAFKEHYKSPVSDLANQQQMDEEMQAQKDEFYNDVIEDMNEIEGLTFDIDDKGTEFTFKITDENRPDPQEYVNNLDNFFNQYVDQDGNWNYDRLNTDMFILNNIDDIVKSVANHYKSQGTEEVVQELKNPSYEGKETLSNNDGPQSVAQQIFNAMRANNDL
tara:strand:+ start:1467 stop:2534 length:1068 start_codon:yes stop_codon:yes gene_type:complete